MHSNQTYNQTYMQYIYISRKRERDRQTECFLWMTQKETKN